MGASKYPGKELYPHLMSPLRIGNIRLKNRIIAAPTSPAMINAEGHMTPAMIAYLAEKAKGGAAVVTYGEAIVHSATGKSHNKQLQLDSFGVKQSLTEATRAIHNAGAYANIQLSHGGKYGGLASVGGDYGKDVTAYGPSEEDLPEGHVEEMPKTLIAEIVEAYGKGAKLVKDCGFDMIMFHAAHGWLFSQFLSPVMNRRTDEYGGPLENRARFMLEALQAVRDAVGPRFPIEIRLSGNDMSAAGLDTAQCIEVAKLIDDKVDLINVSVGNHEDPQLFCRTHPSSFYERGVNVKFAAEVKKHVKSPVSCVGALIDPAQMEEIIASGQADCVEIARGELADPYIAHKALCGHAEDITPCIRCYECFAETGQSETLKCTVNPITGQELYQKEIQPVREQKKVLVAGGGPAGMEAALTCAARGHQVTLVEKADRLGGNLHPAGAAWFKQDIQRLCNVLTARVEASDVNVILNQEVTPTYVKEMDPDALIVAIGSNELRPPIPGMDGGNVVMAIEAELHPEKLGHRIAIMGGGLVGSEAAIAFHDEGHEVAIIEMKEKVAEEVNSFYRGGLMPQVERSAEIYTGTMVKQITPEGVLCVRDGEEILIQADTVVCALGFRAPYDAVDALCETVDESYIAGDCNNVAKIYQAISGGYYIALQI